MRAKYIILLFCLITLFCLVAYSDAEKNKTEFFEAESFISGESVDIFDSVIKPSSVTEFYIETSDTAGNNIAYSVYADGKDGYWLESPDNFSFTVKADKNCEEILIPYEIVDYFSHSVNLYADYLPLIDAFVNVFKNNVSESDFDSVITYVKHDGVRKQCNTLTMNLNKSQALASEFKKFLSSADFTDMINTVFGCDYSQRQLAEYVEQLLPGDTFSLIYKRVIVVGVATEEIISISTANNIYNVKITNESVQDTQTGSITVSDLNQTLDLQLVFKNNDDVQQLDILYNGMNIVVSEEENEIILTFKTDIERVIKIRAAKEYLPQEEFYDMSVPADRRVVFTKLSEWLTGNANAALLFRTYEVDLKPSKINIQDFKFNFDE